METKAYVLKELESGRYRCQNSFIREEDYVNNVVNALMYLEEDEANYHKSSLDRACGKEFVKVVLIRILVED